VVLQKKLAKKILEEGVKRSSHSFENETLSPYCCPPQIVSIYDGWGTKKRVCSLTYLAFYLRIMTDS